MTRNFFVLLGVILLSGCGGSGEVENSAIEGLWRGEVLQGVIECSNGVELGLGASSVVREIEIEVVGGDEDGTTVQASFDNCVLEGVRDTEGFRADVVSGCDQGFSSMRFVLLDEGSATVNFFYDIEKVPAGEGGIRCKASPEALVKRQ